MVFEFMIHKDIIFNVIASLDDEKLGAMWAKNQLKDEYEIE